MNILHRNNEVFVVMIFEINFGLKISVKLRRADWRQNFRRRREGVKIHASRPPYLICVLIPVQARHHSHLLNLNSIF